jgi:hypothetical protein
MVPQGTRVRSLPGRLYRPSPSGALPAVALSAPRPSGPPIGTQPRALHGKSGREARFAALFFQHRLILINDIWLGLAILAFCFLSCITVCRKASTRSSRKGARRRNRVGPWPRWGPKFYCGRGVVMNSRFGGSSGCRTDVSHRSREPTARSEEVRPPISAAG